MKFAAICRSRNFFEISRNLREIWAKFGATLNKWKLSCASDVARRRLTEEDTPPPVRARVLAAEEYVHRRAMRRANHLPWWHAAGVAYASPQQAEDVSPGAGPAPARRAGENEKQGGSVDKKLKLLVLCTVFGGEVPVGLRKFATFPGCKFLFTRSNHAQATGAIDPAARRNLSVNGIVESRFAQCTV